MSFFCLLVKAQPNLIWAKHMAGGGGLYTQGNGVTVDKNHFVYVTGNFEDTVDFDPSPGVYNLVSSLGGTSVFICKLDPSGNLVWAKSFNGNTYKLAYSFAIAVDIKG